MHLSTQGEAFDSSTAKIFYHTKLRSTFVRTLVCCQPISKQYASIILMISSSTRSPLPTTLGRFLAHFLRPYKWATVLLVLVSLLTGLWGPFNAWLNKYIVDAAHTASAGDVSFLMKAGLLWVANFLLFDIGTWWVAAQLHRKYQPLIKNKIISEVFSYTTRAPLGFFQDQLSGRLESQLTILGNTVERMLEGYIPDLLRSSSLLAITFITMWSVDIRFATLLLTWLLVFFIVSYSRSKKLVTLSDAHTAYEAQNSGQLVDIYANIQSVRLFSNGPSEVSRLHGFLDKTKAAYGQMKTHVINLHTLQGSLLALMLAGMLYYLILLYQQQQVTIGDFVLIIGLSIRVGHMIWFAMDTINGLNLAMGRCRQSLKSLLVPHDRGDVPTARPIDISQGAIEFRNVSFKHKTGERGFENLSLQIKPLEKVGLVGFSGTGKSTFVNLVLRLFDLEGGQILIDSQDIAQVMQASLHQQIAMVPQETALFHRSILENIRYGRRDATDEEVMEAARHADAHDFIMKMPEGYNSCVGERGVQLSGGQRQRLSIARAMLTRAPILILDEATSDLDCITERKIHASLEKLMADRTTLVITHRLSMLPYMDRILVFNEDQIIESGSHKELMQRSKYYAEMSCLLAPAADRTKEERI